nr:YbaK/EbsC family protein [uncultured Microbacterium sp.]
MRDAAAARGLEIEILERPAAGSLVEAAELLGIDPSGIVKTLVVKRPSTSSGTGGGSGTSVGSGTAGEYLFALVPGGRSISWPKLRAVVGVNKLRLPEAELALAATGYERGTIVPIGSTTDWPVYADESIVGRRIAMGAGAHGFSLFVDADALIAAYGATVADISEPEKPRD